MSEKMSSKTTFKLMSAFTDEMIKLDAKPNDVLNALTNLICASLLGLRDKLTLQDFIDDLMITHNEIFKQENKRE